MKDRIRQLMEAQHMNQQEFAKFTGLGTASLSSIFTGRTNPTMNHVMAIMKTFPNINPKWLLMGEGGMLLNGNGEDSQQSENSNAGVAGIVIGTGEMTGDDLQKANGMAGGANHSTMQTDNMADELPLFANPAKPAGGYRNASKQPSFASRSETNVPVNPSAVSYKKITEIRVFFDDQTWESFVPKK